MAISIHALREEGDVTMSKTDATTKDFYPRPPRGGRPTKLPATYTEYIFLSTPSARRATGCIVCVYCGKQFLSTPSARRATVAADKVAHVFIISIHALREEGDLPGADSAGGDSVFLSTPSARRATSRYPGVMRKFHYFYPRPPRGGRRVIHLDRPRFIVFLSTPSARRATPQRATRYRVASYFYPRPPRGGRPTNRKERP